MKQAVSHEVPTIYMHPERAGLLSQSVTAIPAEEQSFKDDTKSGWLWPISTSITFLKYALRMTAQSERTIQELRSRIAELEAIATHDELTGILNRRGFMEEFDKESDRIQRNQSQGGLLIMVDLDNFKTINDTYGHQAGDEALRHVAALLKNNIRPMDSCARLGGDEFVLLLSNTESTKALNRAQNLIRQLNSLSFLWYGADIPVRASLGMQDYKKGDKTDSIFAQADGKMYAQKQMQREHREQASH